MVDVRNYNDSVKAFNNALERLKNDSRLPKINRDLAAKWILKHKQALGERYLSKKDREDNAYRMSRTLNKYCTMLSNMSYWFKDFKKIDKKELEQFRKDFLELEGQKRTLKTLKGKTVTYKRDYINKVIKSDFFLNFLKKRDIVRDVFKNKTSTPKNSVEFITLNDVNLLIESAQFEYQKVVMGVLFSTGMRIGTLLNMKKNDFELVYNNKTNVHYYLAHIKKEYTKSQEDRTIPILIPEINDLLTKYFEKVKENDYICPVNYSGVRAFLDKLLIETKIKTKPNNKRPTIHVFRKSAANHLLNTGYSTDQVKAFLGHKPSSNAIDVYVNYSGLKFEPQISKIQTDDLLKLQETLKNNKLQMTKMQRLNDELLKRVNEMQTREQKTASLIIKVLNKVDVLEKKVRKKKKKS